MPSFPRRTTWIQRLSSLTLLYHQLAEIGGAFAGGAHALTSDYADDVIAFIDGLPE